MLHIGLSGGIEQALWGVVGEQATAAEQEQPVAARRLVHDVARDEQRDAVVREAVEQLPQVTAQHRIETDGRLVEHEQLGRAQERGAERDPTELATGQRPGEPVDLGAQVDVVERALDVVVADPEDPREVAQVSPAR